MKQSFFLLSLCLLLVACASSPVSVKNAIDAPAANIYAPKAFIAGAGKGEIVLIRDSSFGGKCSLGVYLDGKLVAAIERKQKLVMYASPGQHILGAGPNPKGHGVCGMFANSMRREATVNVSNAETPRYYRLAMLSGEISIMPTAFH